MNEVPRGRLKVYLGAAPGVGRTYRISMRRGAGPGAGPTWWQDVEALLAAGTDVITAVNVQHLESLRDVVEKITGVPQDETDAVICRLRFRLF
ncbi:hypothetical protein [Streptomyces chartreusis]|uniref:hypothetical protein n=1 Tax=Streptomyces chartreusis TaxID=1969 RepID=UPI003F4CC337